MYHGSGEWAILGGAFWDCFSAYRWCCLLPAAYILHIRADHAVSGRAMNIHAVNGMDIHGMDVLDFIN